MPLLPQNQLLFRLRAAAAFGLLANGCGGPPPAAGPPTRLQNVDGPTTVTVEMASEQEQAAKSAKKPAPDLRILPPEADFGRLVAAANALDERDSHLS